jgi:hypothetical protein
MTTFLIVLGILFVIALLYWNHKRKLAAVPAANNGMGVQLRKAAEQIPVYGQVVKVAGVVGKPVNNALDKFTGYQISALKHVPVVGNVLAKPAEIAQSTVKKFNSWIGL